VPLPPAAVVDKRVHDAHRFGRLLLLLLLPPPIPFHFGRFGKFVHNAHRLRSPLLLLLLLGMAENVIFYVYIF
jgi:hypothetical protein